MRRKRAILRRRIKRLTIELQEAKTALALTYPIISVEKLLKKIQKGRC